MSLCFWKISTGMVCRVGWRGESHEPRETGVSCIVQERGDQGLNWSGGGSGNGNGQSCRRDFFKRVCLALAGVAQHIEHRL